MQRWGSSCCRTRFPLTDCMHPAIVGQLILQRTHQDLGTLFVGHLWRWFAPRVLRDENATAFLLASQPRHRPDGPCTGRCTAFARLGP